MEGVLVAGVLFPEWTPICKGKQSACFIGSKIWGKKFCNGGSEVKLKRMTEAKTRKSEPFCLSPLEKEISKSEKILIVKQLYRFKKTTK